MLNNQRGSFQIILGVLILLLIVGGGAYFLGTNKYQILYKLQGLSPERQTLPLPTPIPCHNDPSKRQFDINTKFMGNQNYPAELTSICDYELLGMSCLDPYTRQTDGNYVFNTTEIIGSNEISTSLKVTQEDVLDNINRIIRKLNGKSPDKIRFCAIDRGDLIAEYETQQKGSSDNTLYLAILYAQGGVEEIASIPSGGIPNFTCNKLLQLTNSDLYVECYGGNNSPSSKAIYKISMDPQNKMIVRLLQCASILDESGQSEVKCLQPTILNNNSTGTSSASTNFHPSSDPK